MYVSLSIWAPRARSVTDHKCPQKPRLRFRSEYQKKRYQPHFAHVALPPTLGQQREGSADNTLAGLPKFTKLTAPAALLDIQNIDTNMIIPKEFLKTVQRAGLGFAAFAKLRYENPEEVATLGEEVNKPRSDFVLNQAQKSNGQCYISKYYMLSPVEWHQNILIVFIGIERLPLKIP